MRKPTPGRRGSKRRKWNAAEGRWERGGAGAVPGAGLRAGCATAPPCCALPAVPRGRQCLRLASPFVYHALSGVARLGRRGGSLGSRRRVPGPAALFSSFAVPPASSPRPESGHWAASSPRPAAHPPHPARGARSPHARSPAYCKAPHPTRFSATIPGLQGGENKLKAEQLRDSNKTPST